MSNPHEKYLQLMSSDAYTFAHVQTYAIRWALDEITRLREDKARLDKAREIVFSYTDNEITSHPWWAVMRNSGRGSAAVIAGPFFSRERAEQYRQARLHEHGKATHVFCFAGHYSRHYRDLIEALKPDADRTEAKD